MKLYWMELRRSPLRWWFPLFVALDLAALFGRSRWWIGDWPQTSVQTQIPAFYFAPLLAAGAAWAAGRTSRNNLDAQLGVAARPAWRIELTQLFATLTYGVAAYGVGVVAAAVVSAPTAGPGFLWPSYVLLGVALVVAFASAGHLVGHWSRSQFVGPVICGLGSFVVIGWAGAPKALGLFVLSGDPFKQVALPALIARCLLAVLLVAAAGFVRRSLLPAHRAWNGTASRVGAVTICVSLCVAVVGLLATAPVQVERSAPRQPLCTTGSPAVCLWPDDRKYLPQAQGMTERLRQLPSGMFSVPPVFYERGVRGPQHAFEDFYILEGSMWDASETVAGSILHASRPQGCPLPLGDKITPQFVLATGELNMWLAMRIYGGGRPADMHGGPPGVDMDAIARVITQPEGEQLAWVTQRTETIHHAYCG
ncbi:hypothetical protein [Kitasatospora sp. NPDC056531]|uniref:hypothetical protein n=1 Tax=Kitasatospora sp. NPDC056531 TaxID=3345856 RepID=UPI00369C38DE